MGKSADRLASAFEISRKAQDEYSLRTHTLARKAQKVNNIISFKLYLGWSFE